MDTKTQRRFTLTLDDSVPLSKKQKAAKERFLNDPQPLAPSRGLARFLRDESRAAIEELTACAGAHLPGNLRAARVLKTLIQCALDEGLVSEIERERTERQLAHPLTVADFLAALEHTITAHRAPAFFMAGEDLKSVQALITGHFAAQKRQLDALLAVAGVGEVNTDNEGGAR